MISLITGNCDIGAGEPGKGNFAEGRPDGILSWETLENQGFSGGKGTI